MVRWHWAGQAEARQSDMSGPSAACRLLPRDHACVHHSRRRLIRRRQLFPTALPLQVGFVVYPAGGEVDRHVHGRSNASRRDLRGPRRHQGKLRDRPVRPTEPARDDGELRADDIILLVEGGHGFRMMEDTVLLEVEARSVHGPRREGAFLTSAIPVNEPVARRAGDRLRAPVPGGRVDLLRGRFIDEFEDAWAAYCGRRHGVAVSNGTVALQVAVAALGLEPGDEVIMPTFTIISCAPAVLAAGATPVLVDCDPRTWCMDVDQVRARGSRPHTGDHARAHLRASGRHGPVLELAETHGLAVIEDAAEAHGAEYLSGRSGTAWRRCGSFGDLSCFSFYANKLLTTGEGGMVLTDDDGLAARLRSLRNLGFHRTALPTTRSSASTSA